LRSTAGTLTPPGWAILIAASLLMLIGIASIYVTDTHYSLGHDGPKNAGKQCVFAIAGLVVAAAVLRTGYERIARFAYPIFFVVLVALVPLLVARITHNTFGGLTKPLNGAYRWIRLPGLQLQPSEFMKIAYLLALAAYLRHGRSCRKPGDLVVPLAMSVFPLFMILLQPDLGTVLLLIPVLFIVLFMAGARIRHLGLIALIGVSAAPAAWFHMKSYQRLRVTAVLLQSERLRQAIIDSPEDYELLATKREAVEWAASSGYQLVHSKNAIGSGGLFGQGWGNGVYVDSGLIPDRHNDFVFAVIAHQWGFGGSLVVLLCYAVVAVAGVRIASACVEPFGRLLAVGIVALLSMQVVINIGMAVGLLPVTGMTLPFVSYGGSSLLTNFAAAALLVSVAQHRPFLLATKPFEFRREHTEMIRSPRANGSSQPAEEAAGTLVPKQPSKQGHDKAGVLARR